MMIIMHPDATEDDVARIVDELRAWGAEATITTDDGHTMIEGTSDATLQLGPPWQSLPGVASVLPDGNRERRVARDFKPADTVVTVGSVAIGDGSLCVAAGPCAVEGREQLISTAAMVQRSGAAILRGDAFKPRTSPYSFQGLGKAGLEILAEARAVTGLPVVAEVLDTRDVDMVAAYADMVRVGARNMANYALLREVGRQSKPVMLKRSRAATVEEWIDAAEHVHNAGNPNIVLVERGVRGIDNSARNMLDITAVPVAKRVSHLPVMVDPSHAAGRSDIVAPLARAAVAAGADGLLLDVHPRPEDALVDGAQALLPMEFEELMADLRLLVAALSRETRAADGHSARAGSGS